MVTAIGVLGAILGLIFTAVATYYDAAVSEDQLNQSREAAEQESRSQAMRLTYWQDASWVDGSLRVHLLNRSPDPVTDVHVTFDGYGKSDVKGAHMWGFTIPPCTESIYRAEQLRYTYTSKGHVVKEGNVRWQVQSLSFTDSDGKMWKRVPTNLDRLAMRPHAPNSYGVAYAGQPALKPAENCGGNG
ncbi:hypothetical protein OHB35_53210 [Streptomyces phaeochromogenes]|uniref:Uncharacterized protein n=1 Tax=Streptomyces phaeochromogenes TaxID=1923 RepID=A0ABZ1HRR1_STRPH|nr:hypothetical protein [Streptomyces phaeochromogenes]WSD11752.1 hypothetical protein OHB35_00125 [Streptomyces phaeochromogenes]WSD21297.1 hypothetical protein OHB35_53210 [Streptomyces phaeochromogenes]